MCCNTKILFLTVSGRGHSTVWLDLYSKGIAAVSQQNPSSKKMDLITTSKRLRLGSQRDDNPKPVKLSGKMCRIISALKRY